MEPKIRLKGFSGEWNFCNISSITNRYDNVRVPVKETERISGNIPYYGANGIQDYVDGFTHDGEYILVAEDGANDLEHYPVQYVNGKVWVNNHAHVLQGKKEIASTSYLKYAISCLDIKSALVGGGRSKLNSAALMSLELNIPSLSEQEALGEFFQHVDSLIQSNEKKIESLKQVKAASLQSMFPQEGETTPRVRFKGFEGEWEDISLGEETYPAGIKNHDNLPLESFSISNEYGFIPQNVQFENGGTMATADKRMYYIVSKNSFGYNPARINVGSLGYYTGEDDVIVSSLYEIFKTSDRICDTFLLYWFKTSTFQKLIEQYQEGGVRFYFFYDKLCMCHTLVPSYEEQQKIADYFTNLDSQISLQTQRLEKLKQIKSACLDNMFV